MLAKDGFESLDLPRLRALKRKGFSDARIAKSTARDEAAIRSRRRKLGLHPVDKRVDTCAAEFTDLHRLPVPRPTRKSARRILGSRRRS